MNSQANDGATEARPAAGRLGTPYVLDGPVSRPWWSALTTLARALDTPRVMPEAHVTLERVEDARAAHALVVRGLIGDRVSDLPTALADAVLFGEGTWSELAEADIRADGVAHAARHDLERFCILARRAWSDEVAALAGALVPDACALAAPAEHGAAVEARDVLARALAAGDADRAWSVVSSTARLLGAGPLARYEAYAWEGDAFRGIEAPAHATHEQLIGLERPLARLEENVAAFLDDLPALSTLLYGPRGSGKSTAVRALLSRHRARGLRLAELAGHRLDALPTVLEALRRRPQHHVLFLDDLSFEHADPRMRELKSLLEGSVRAGPERVLVVATSNRRHLVRERFSARPGPGDDDVHAWDTHHDALALADRFGLVITFPDADARAYLSIVSTLARRAGVEVEGLDERALRFASWGNGLSGRTARHFVDVLVREAGR
ncbi:hypothetical protein BH23DEI1_BH23DEI1_20480 [soil metagenome]